MLAGGAVHPALGHPHVWITVRAELVFSDSLVTEVRQHWTFDPAYSAYAIQGLGSADGTLNEGQLRQLAMVNTESLGEFGYFTFLKVNGQNQVFSRPRDTAMVLEGGRLTLTYSLPVKTPFSPGQAFSFEYDDPTYFVSFTLAADDDAVRLVDAPPCTVSVNRPTPPVAGGNFADAFSQALSSQSGFGTIFAIKAQITCH